MHPILFRIPLPATPLKLWWGLAAVIAIAIVYAIIGLRKRDRATAAIAFVVAIGVGIVAKVYAHVEFTAPNLPIYSYGVMLGLSLVVGWYLTLTLSERDGLPKETMANCYVITAIAAIVGSRVLYILTNLDEFRMDVHDSNSAMDFASFFALRRGGLVAYGGFLGGYLGSWLYLRSHRLRLMPWADVAVPSLAAGLLITRIGCYLFGCDFGKRLPETAPAWLAKLGTFPHWAKGTLEGGDGSPAWVKHLSSFQGAKLEELKRLDHSFPVHPTQIYESIVGLLLLMLLLWQRKNQKFRGQIFFLFAFAYGYLRFLIEFLRDDAERGEIGRFSLHWFVGVSLLLFALAFTFGISLGIANKNVRTGARVLSFLPAIAGFILLMPGKFAETISYAPSTSQWIGLVSGLLVAFFYASFWETARKSPKLAMSLESLGDVTPERDDAPKPAKKKKKKRAPVEEGEKMAAVVTPPVESAEAAPEEVAPPDEDEDEDEDGDDDDDDGTSATGDEPAKDTPVAAGEDDTGDEKKDEKKDEPADV
jgi:phosphatidylglycerol---prolipoprotein diacylglyceryl transferase